jgi:hypothetical protein
VHVTAIYGKPYSTVAICRVCSTSAGNACKSTQVKPTLDCFIISQYYSEGDDDIRVGKEEGACESPG